MRLELKEKINKIKLLLLDVDGVLTDESIIYGPFQDEIKIFNVKDGLGIELAQAAGLTIGIITSRHSDALKKRAKELGIDVVYQGQKDKLEIYQQIKKDLSISNEQIAFVGDDLPDLKILKIVGFSVAVANACEKVKNTADFITKKSGGQGAVREVVEKILKVQGKWEQVVGEF